MATKERLDKIVVNLGLAETRNKAQALIMAGQILVKDQPVTKAGHLISLTDPVRLRGEVLKYVGRGGLKLERALDVFRVNPSGRVCLDCGASTGGFTDCLLQRGAARVHAVDVGYGQMDWRLRNDPRVILHERTNLRHMTLEDLGGEAERISLAALDLSFISLRLVMGTVREFLDPSSSREVVALIKPQFEAGKGEVPKGGIIRDPEQHRRILTGLTTALLDDGWVILGLIPSPILGGDGNIEFLGHLSLVGKSIETPARIESVVEEAHQLKASLKGAAADQPVRHDQEAPNQEE